MNNNRLYIGLLAVALVALSACATAPHTPQGQDQLDRQRGGALAVFLDRKITDSLDTKKGDTIDWKFVDVPSSGQLLVELSVDAPSGLNGKVVLRDNFATVLEQHEFAPGRSRYAFEPVEATRGRYYIQIEATGGGSVYTVGATFREPALGEFQTVDTKFDESEERTRTGGGGGGDKRTNVVKGRETTVREGGPSTKTDGEERGNTDDNGAPAAGSITVTGNIVRVIPLDDGGAEVTVKFPAKFAGKVKNGARGKIQGVGASLRVRRASGKAVVGTTKADADKVKAAKTVVFTVAE